MKMLLWSAPGIFRSCFWGEKAGVEKPPAVGEGDDVVELGVDDQQRFRPAGDLVDVAETGFLPETDGRRVDAQQLQQRSGAGEAAFDDQAG